MSTTTGTGPCMHLSLLQAVTMFPVSTLSYAWGKCLAVVLLLCFIKAVYQADSRDSTSACELQAMFALSDGLRCLTVGCACSELRRLVETISEERSADAQQAQRQIEVAARQLAAAQQQLQLKADIIHQLTGGLQVTAFFPSPLLP